MLRVILSNEAGESLWEFQQGIGGYASKSYLNDGAQQRVIDALLAALIEARAQLGCTLHVADVVPYASLPPAKVNHRVPMT